MSGSGADSSCRACGGNHHADAEEITMLTQQRWLWAIVYATASPTFGSEPPSLLKVDYRWLVSAADLVYRAPAPRSLEGLPVGKRVMGTMVWTSPSGIRFQINRNDVFAVNKQHAAGAQFGSTDYCGTCAQVTVDVGGQSFEASDAFEQRLLLYDANVTLA